MSSFTDQKPRIATEKECKANWGGGKPGEFFRCHVCGHRFRPGDKFRWVYTNHLRGYGGNPMVCEACDGTNEEVIARWKKLVDQWKDDRNGKYWWFVKYERSTVDPRENM
jgi:hypothetical protein